MRIAVNARLLLKNKLDGIGWYTYQTLKRITTSHPEHEFILLFDRKFDDDFIFSDNITPVVIRPPSRHPFLWIIWFEWSVRRIIKKIKPDLFVSMDGFLCLSTDIPSVVIIHDLSFLHRPKDLPLFNSLYYRFFFPRFAEKAVFLGTVSEYSKNDIINSLGIDDGRIVVVYNGAHELYKPVSEEIKSMTREKYTNGSPYFIFVGSIHPRKNLVNLLKAFGIFRSEMSDFKLIIVGQKLFRVPGLYRTHSNMVNKHDVIFTGRMGQEELPLLMASAEALVYIPFFEGFGIPLVEAMYSEIPILASDRTAVPEIVGDAALITNPYDIEDIAKKMVRIVKDYPLRKRLIDAGKERRKLYNWDLSAEKLWLLIMDALKISKYA